VVSPEIFLIVFWNVEPHRNKIAKKALKTNIQKDNPKYQNKPTRIRFDKTKIA